MTTPITRGSAPRLLQEGLLGVFNSAVEKHESKFDKIFEVKTSRKSFEVMLQMEGFGRSSEKDEGDDITFDTRQQGISPKFIHVTQAKGFIITEEAQEDELYDQYTDGPQALADSMTISRELDAHSVLNNGFDTNYTMTDGDGLPLFSTAHLFGGTDGNTYSNRLTVDADLSEASLEDMSIQIMNFKDERNLQRALMAKRLIIAPANVFEAQRILGSVLQNDTANNATNALRDLGIVKDGFLVSPYLTDTDAWYLTTNHPKGLTFFQRVAISFGQDNAFTSGNARYKARQRYSYGWGAAAGIFGSQGA